MTRPANLRVASVVLAAGLCTGMPAPAQQPQPDAVLELLRQIQDRYRAQDWAAAVPLLERIVEINPHVADFWHSLGMARSRMREHRGAIAALEKALELGAGSASNNVAYEIARNYGFLGEKGPALEWLQRALESGFRRRENIRGDAAFTLLHGDATYQALAMPVDTASMSRAEGWAYDISFLELEVGRLHYDPFRKVSKAVFESEARRLREEAAGLTDNQIIVRLMALLSMIGDGHTGCFPDLVPAWSQTVPVQFEIFREGLFIVAAEPGSADFVGVQVLRFGAHPWEQVIEKLSPLISKDNSQGVLRSAPSFLRYPQILNGLGLQAESDRLQMTIRAADGEEQSVTVAAAPTDPEFNRISGHPRWVTAYQDAPGPVPLYLKDRRTFYWFEHLAQKKTVYFQFNSVSNDPEEPIDRFIDRLFEFIDQNEVQTLVIDMRWNNGGNTLLLPPLLRALASDRAVTRLGHLFVIVGRYTYSAAMNAATFLEGQTEAILVGEPTPSSPNYVGESNIIGLPYSQTRVSISDLFWQSSWPFDQRTWVAPLLPIPPSFEAYKAKRDPALEAILDSRPAD
ncbi:MAG: hypothetical protein EYC70_09970 [Planctomycetota bacterium]|nr:MAG: hypothetical protein EYC70_09970 [Planctomycetota bacterium]